MNNSSSAMLIPFTLDHLVEGSHEDETLEPTQSVKTAVLPLPITRMGLPPFAAETGVLQMVNVQTESQDHAAEVQDASLTPEEAKPISVSASVPQKAPVAATALTDAAAKTPTILIIEDTTELAEVIQATLERIKMQTLHETHGARAIALLQDKNPDLVLLDIALPDMTGWKILDAIKETHARRGVQMPIVIVISAYGDPANRLVGKLQGVHNYLIKPFTPDEVEKVVTEALRSAAI